MRFKQLGLVDHRRAASLRRPAARDAAREGAAARRAGDDGDADSAHARADALRRSRRVGDPRAAAGPPAGQHDRQARIAARRDPRVRPRASSRRAGRPTSSIRWSRSRRRSISRPRPRWPTPSPSEVFPEFRVGAAARPDESRRQRAGDEGLRGRRDPHARLHDGRRGRRRRAERQRDGRRARGALRPVAAAPAARPRRPRSAPVVLLPAVSGAAVRRRARAAEGDDRHDRRVRDRRARPAAARPGRFLRHPPGRRADVPRRSIWCATASCSKQRAPRSRRLARRRRRRHATRWRKSLEAMARRGSSSIEIG